MRTSLHSIHKAVTSPCAAEQLAGKEEVQRLQQQVRAAMNLPNDHNVAFVELLDALTSLLAHGKAIPEGLTPELLRAIEVEAVSRTAYSVAPQRQEPHAQEVLRLGLGHLIAEVRLVTSSVTHLLSVPCCYGAEAARSSVVLLPLQLPPALPEQSSSAHAGGGPDYSCSRGQTGPQAAPLQRA